MINRIQEKMSSFFNTLVPDAMNGLKREGMDNITRQDPSFFDPAKQKTYDKSDANNHKNGSNYNKPSL